jgi:hypothetical protein
MPSLASWRRLTPARRALLPRAVLLVAAVRIGLLALRFGTLRRLLSSWRSRPWPGRAALTESDIIWCVSRASRVVPGATCLTRSLVADILLARRGIDPHVRIGVRRASDGHGLEAHAWVEVGRRVVICREGADRYALLCAATVRRPNPRGAAAAPDVGFAVLSSR